MSGAGEENEGQQPAACGQAGRQAEGREAGKEGGERAGRVAELDDEWHCEEQWIKRKAQEEREREREREEEANRDSRQHFRRC